MQLDGTLSFHDSQALSDGVESDENAEELDFDSGNESDWMLNRLTICKDDLKFYESRSTLKTAVWEPSVQIEWSHNQSSIIMITDYEVSG